MSAPHPSRSPIRFGQASPDTRLARPFGRLGASLGMLILAVVIGGLAWAAASGRPAAAERPHIFGGSLVLGDTRPLTVIDVATARITVRLEGVDSKVGAQNYGDVQPVPVSGGTVLVNRVSGSFNFLATDDYVIDPDGPGVSLGPLVGSTGAEGLGAGADAYIVRSAPRSTVSLVGAQTVQQAAREAAAQPAGTSPTVTPLGSATLSGRADLSPGSAAVAGNDLWALVEGARGCQVMQFDPAPTTRSGLASTARSGTGGSCSASAVEWDGVSVGVASPGLVRVLAPDFPSGPPAPAVVVPTPFTAGARSLLPVTGSTGTLWYLASSDRGWLMFGVTPEARITGPFSLPGLGAGAQPAIPVLSGGTLYTLDRSASPQPTLWTIAVANGQMAPLPGVPRYPVLNSTERADFTGAQIILDGPRVVFNNPQSLEAVVVFTDSDRRPVVVDKSLAVAISTTGPADISTGAPTTTAPGQAPTPKASPVPAVAPVNQQITCAKTTQKPYAPQITAVTPAPQSVTVAWAYQLLDQTDCQPDSWAVQVTALNGGRQPDRPVQVVTGQDQFTFTGLRPTTTYEVVVTAYINSQSTPSSPATFTTLARGPDAPLSVQTTADGAGDWVVSWTPCTEAANPNCVVPAANWSVIGAACGGGFVGTPPTVTVTGDKTTATINAAQLQMLGDSLSFSVQGTLPSGLTGNPTSDGSCTQAWEKPTADQVAVGSSAIPAPGNTITATVSATASGDLGVLEQTHPSDVEFTYALAGQTVGPTNSTSATFYGLQPGAYLVPSVTVYPAGHPDAAVTVNGPPVHQTIPWPADLTSASAQGSPDPSDPNQGSFTVTFPPDLPKDPLTATGPVLQCGGSGGATRTYPDTPLTNGQLTLPVDLVNMGGTCAVRFTLVDGANPNPYGIASPPLDVGFTIGQTPSYTFTDRYPDACSNGPDGNKCGPGGQPWQLVVSSPSPSLAAGANWSVTVELRDPQTGQETVPDPCRTTGSPPPPLFPYTVSLPGACDPSLTPNLDVTVSFTYIGQTDTVDAGAPANQPGSDVPLPTTTTTAPATTTTTTTTTLTTTTAASSTSSSTTGGPAAPAVPAGEPGLTVMAGAGAAASGLMLVGAGRRLRSRRPPRRDRRTHPSGKGDHERQP